MKYEYLKLLKQYQNLFNDLVSVAYKAYKQKTIDQTSSKYLKVLYSKIIKMHTEFNKNYALSKVDIEQQLRLIWFNAINNFNEKQPSIHIKQYLIRISIFRLRDWFRKEMNISSIVPVEEIQNKEWPKFNLDLNFVCLGSDEEPWNTLYPYERYLLYLYYNKELSINKIANRLGWNKDTVNSKLNNTIYKLRSNFVLDSLVA